MYYSSKYSSPVGEITLACRGESLVGLWIAGQKYHGASVSGELVPCDDTPVILRAKAWLNRYFAGENPELGELALAPEGSDFRREVWRILCEIPYGKLTTYGEIARQIGHKTSARAVGGAVGHNPVSIIIPCHRVVGANGSLTGYAGGLDVKKALLRLEGALSE